VIVPKSADVNASDVPLVRVAPVYRTVTPSEARILYCSV